ncbi:hypothetical protein SynBOUM118_00624 [Synechococcus sp. BOUM118]|nr:hypothetical protein SynBOUM118_00624 [Synechococcus sp. BOUM118]
MIDPIHAHYRHRGRLIPILLIADLGQQWEAYVEGSLKKVSKHLVLTADTPETGD